MRFVEDNGWKVAHLGAKGVAEERQLQRGNADHHRECQAIAAHLNELLSEHRPDARAAKGARRKPVVQVHAASPALPSSRCWRAMNASSIVATPNWRVTSSGVPSALSLPRERKARRAHW